MKMMTSNYANPYAMAWVPELFADFLGTVPQRKHMTTPSVNVSEDKSAYTLEFAIPGVPKETVSVQLTNEGKLQVNIEVKNEAGKVEDEKKWLRREFSYSGYKHNFVLPDEVDSEGITAMVAQGILSIRLPKKQVVAPQTNRLIEIQ